MVHGLHYPGLEHELAPAGQLQDLMAACVRQRPSTWVSHPEPRLVLGDLSPPMHPRRAEAFLPWQLPGKSYAPASIHLGDCGCCFGAVCTKWGSCSPLVDFNAAGLLILLGLEFFCNDCSGGIRGRYCSTFSTVQMLWATDIISQS